MGCFGRMSATRNTLEREGSNHKSNAHGMHSRTSRTNGKMFVVQCNAIRRHTMRCDAMRFLAGKGCFVTSTGNRPDTGGYNPATTRRKFPRRSRWALSHEMTKGPRPNPRHLCASSIEDESWQVNAQTVWSAASRKIPSRCSSGLAS